MACCTSAASSRRAAATGARASCNFCSSMTSSSPRPLPHSSPDPRHSTVHYMSIVANFRLFSFAYQSALLRCLYLCEYNNAYCFSCTNFFCSRPFLVLMYCFYRISLKADFLCHFFQTLTPSHHLRYTCNFSFLDAAHRL